MRAAVCLSITVVRCATHASRSGNMTDIEAITPDIDIGALRRNLFECEGRVFRERAEHVFEWAAARVQLIDRRPLENLGADDVQMLLAERRALTIVLRVLGGEQP